MYNHHDPDCPNFTEPGLDAIQQTDFADLFCDCHRYAEPHILANGTAIAWPKGWDAAMAREWREKKNLVKTTL